MRRLPRFSVELVEPDGDVLERPPGLVARTRAAWRPWMTASVLAVVCVTGISVPLPLRVHAPGAVLDAATVVDVGVDTRTNPDGTRSVHTGTYLVPTSSAPATPLEVLTAAVRPDRRTTREVRSHPLAPDPVEAALVTAVGVAPGRARAADLGLTATVERGLVDPRALGVVLEVFDRASTTDLSRGRTVLALGTVGLDGTIGCPADAGSSLRAARDVDVVLTGTGCPAADVDPAALLIEVSTFADALAAMAPAGG